MLTYSPKARISVSEALASPWFKTILSQKEEVMNPKIF